ncbi:MAG: PKD domain-containing protein [bacterium]
MSCKAKIIVLALVALAAIGCSSGGANPTMPDLRDRAAINQSEKSNIGLWGLWDVSLNPATQTVEIVPLREAEYTVDVTGFMQPPKAKTNLMKIAFGPGTDWPNGHIEAEVGFTHPFPGIGQYTGFDVRGVCIGDGSQSGLVDPDIVYAGDNELTVLNADGLTRWYNPSEFTKYNTLFGFTLGKLGIPSYDWTAILNSYKYYCDGLGKNDDLLDFFADPSCPNPRGMFSAGNTNTRTFVLQFPIEGGSPVYRFQYAVIASWTDPLVVPPVNIPDDFSISANCPEAYAISVSDQSDMYYIDPSTKGGTMKLLVRIFDHQGAVSSTGIADEISAVHIETPGGLITTGGYATFDSSALAGSLIGQDSISATWLLNVADVDPYQSGEFPVLLAIESANPSNYDNGIPGFPYPEDAKLAAYFETNVSVGADLQSEDPVAVAEIITGPPYCPDDPIEFDASGSYDPDGGSIVSYEWDFDGDGTYGDPYNAGTDENPIKIFTDFGTYEIDVLVTDDEGATDTLDVKLTLSIGGATWVDDDAVAPFDGTFDHPWPTIQQGISNATGDCGQKWVLVKDGTYIENITMISDITVEGYSTPAPVIASVDGSAMTMINFGSVSGSKLKHFRAKPKCISSTDAIRLSGSNNMVDDIEFIDNPGGETCRYAVTVSGANTANDVRCDGYHKSAAGFINASGAGAKVTNCVLLHITYTAASSVVVLAASNIGATGLIAKNVIGHITFSEAFPSTQWVTTVSLDYCQDATIRNNLIFDINNNLGDVGWTWGIDAYRPVNTTLEHNTIVGIKGPAWIYAFETTNYNQPPSMAAHRDHIIANLTAGTMNWRWAFLGYWESTAYVDYSCTYSVGNSFKNSMAAGIGFLDNVNPQFLNAAGDDFRVASTSPCHNAAHDGTDMGAYGGSDPLTGLP